MVTWEKSEFRNELLRNSQLPSIPARHWSWQGPLKMKHGQTFSWSREHMEANGDFVANHYSASWSAASANSRKDAETKKKSQSHPPVTVTRTGGQMARAFFFVEGTQLHLTTEFFVFRRNVVFNKTIAGRRRTLLLNVKPARMSVKTSTFASHGWAVLFQ